MPKIDQTEQARGVEGAREIEICADAAINVSPLETFNSSAKRTIIGKRDPRGERSAAQRSLTSNEPSINEFRRGPR